MDPEYYRDEVEGIEGPITFQRSFPHLMFGKSVSGQMKMSNGLPILHREFWLDLECGNDPTQDIGNQLSVEWSDDRGRTWGQAVLQSAGKIGQYNTFPAVGRDGPCGGSNLSTDTFDSG